MGTHRIAVCSWSTCAENPASLIHALRGLEIDAVQLALTPLVLDGAWAAAPETLREAGITIVSGMLAMEGEDYATLESIARTGGVRDDDLWPRNLALATRVAACASANGIGLVTMHAGFLPEDAGDPLRRTMLDRLHLIADAFEQRSVDLAFETGQESAATLLGVLEALGRDRVGVNFDPANMILYGRGDPVEALRRLRPHVRQVHVKDALPADEPGRWGTEVPAGSGAVDWAGFFEAARAIEPPVDFVIEREAGEHRAADITAAQRLVERWLRSEV